MPGAHVRALYDSEAVLRRLAGALRALGEDDPGEPSIDENSASDPLPSGQRLAASHAASSPETPLLGALWRGHDILDVLDRMLAGRGRSETARETGPGEP